MGLTAFAQADHTRESHTMRTMKSRIRQAIGRITMATGLAASMLAFSLALSPGAEAARAYTTDTITVFGGPSPEYPPIFNLYPGTPVEVYGCIQGWTWCDVSFEGNRGWAYGEQLDYPYQGRRVPIYGFGYRLGLPIIGFSFDDYWGRYYRDRPFWGERDRFRDFRFGERYDFHHEGRPDFGRGPERGPERGPDFNREGRPDFRPDQRGGNPGPQGGFGRAGDQRPPQQAAPQQTAPQQRGAEQRRPQQPAQQQGAPQQHGPQAAQPAPHPQAQQAQRPPQGEHPPQGERPNDKGDHKEEHHD
jgi:uncharacterized protein YraI